MTIRHGLNSAILTLYFVLLSACGGGGGSDEASVVDSDTQSNESGSDSSSLNEGVFLDSAVGNLAYETATQEGFTDAQGTYLYANDELITFSIGGIALPPVQAKGVLTPLDVMSASSITNPAVVNLARLLQTIDTDGDPDNGIQISTQAHAAASDMAVDFSSATFDADVTNLIENSGAINRVLVDAASAISHLNETLNSIGLETDFGRFAAASVSQQSILPGQVCVAGGIEINTGFDINQNGSLDTDEVTEVQIVCHGEAGKNSLLRITELTNNSQCLNSGKVISTGLDQNADGVLQNMEIVDTVYLCDSNIGANGINGYNSLVNVSVELAGQNCLNGGQQIQTGQDLNRDGVLQNTEVHQSRYVCNGLSQSELGPVLIKLTEDNENLCLHEGTISSIGNDLNSNGILDDDEVTSTSYICRNNTAPYLSLGGYSDKDAQNRFLTYAGVGIEAAWTINGLDMENDAVTMTIESLPNWLQYEEYPTCNYDPCDTNMFMVGNFVGTPSIDDKGFSEVIISLSDGERSRLETILIEVAEPIVLSITDNIKVTEGMDSHAELVISLPYALDIETSVFVNSERAFSVCSGDVCEPYQNPISFLAGETTKTLRFDIPDNQAYSPSFDIGFHYDSNDDLSSRFWFSKVQPKQRIVEIIDNDPKPIVAFNAPTSSTSYYNPSGYDSVQVLMEGKIESNQSLVIDLSYSGSALDYIDSTSLSREVFFFGEGFGYSETQIQDVYFSFSMESIPNDVELTITLSSKDDILFGDATEHTVTLRNSEPFGLASISPELEDGFFVIADHVVHQDYVYLVGSINGVLENQTNLGGGSDSFVGKFQLNGEQVWAKQLGTDLYDEGFALNVDANGDIVLISEQSQYGAGAGTVMLSKYTNDGQFLWEEPLDTEAFRDAEIILDTQNNIILAVTDTGAYYDDEALEDGDQENHNFFLQKRNANGAVIWEQNDLANIHTGYWSNSSSIKGVVLDIDGNIIMAHSTYNDLSDQQNQGNNDIAVIKFASEDGTSVWGTLLGSQGNDRFKSITADGEGNILLTADTDGAFDGSLPKGLGDAVVAKLNAQGQAVWIKQLGSYSYDYAGSIVGDGKDNIYFGASFGAAYDNGSQHADVLTKIDLNGNATAVQEAGYSFEYDGFYFYDSPSATSAVISTSETGEVYLHQNIGTEVRLRKFDQDLNIL